MRSKRAPTAGGNQTKRSSEQESEPAKKAKTVSISKELDHYFGTGWHRDVKDYCIRGGHILTSLLPSGRRVYFLNTSLVPPPAIEDDNKDIPCSGPTNICCVFCLTNFTNIGSVAAHANKCKFKFMRRDLNCSWGELILEISKRLYSPHITDSEELVKKTKEPPSCREGQYYTITPVI